MTAKSGLQENDEFREYVEKFDIETLMTDMMNAALFQRNDKPLVSMIRFLANLIPEHLLNGHGIYVKSDSYGFYWCQNWQGEKNERKIEDVHEENDFPELSFKRVYSLEEINLDKSPEILKKIESVGSKSISSGSISD